MEKTIVGLSDAVEAFLLSCRVKGCTNLTLRTYQEVLARLRGVSSDDLAELTRLSVQRYFATLQNTGLKQVAVHKHYRTIGRLTKAKIGKLPLIHQLILL